MPVAINKKPAPPAGKPKGHIPQKVRHIPPRVVTPQRPRTKVVSEPGGHYGSATIELPIWKTQSRLAQSRKGTNFGYTLPIEPIDMYLPKITRSMGTGSVTTNMELGLTVTDFFDYEVLDPTAGGVAQPVSNYFWDIDQNLFLNGTSTNPFDDRERTFCRVRKLEVYVLPVKGFEIGAGTGPNNNNAEGQFTVNCQTPGVSTVNAQQVEALNTQVTNVLPQLDTFWKKVFTCDLQKTFESGVARPYFDTVVNNSDQCLFQMSIVNPVDGSSYLSPSSNNLVIRVKVVLHVDQPIATIQNANLVVFRNETFLTPSLEQNGIAFPGTSESYVQTNLKSVSDHLR